MSKLSCFSPSHEKATWFQSGEKLGFDSMPALAVRGTAWIWLAGAAAFDRENQTIAAVMASTTTPPATQANVLGRFFGTGVVRANFSGIGFLLQFFQRDLHIDHVLDAAFRLLSQATPDDLSRS
jgi:hypothetical protein